MTSPEKAPATVVIPDDIETFRAEAVRQAAPWPRALTGLPAGTYETVTLPAGAPVAELMVYRPPQATAAPGVFVNLHGGGFVMGDWQSDDPFCRLLADTAGCAVVNLDYPLAPEHPFPAAVEQTHAVLVWLTEHGAEIGVDPSRIAVGGHSAGGNLAAALCLLARERGEFAIIYQVLNYPPLDAASDPLARPATDAFLQPRDMVFFNKCYFRQPADAQDPLASPLLAADLAGLPAALIITAEYDLLREDGERYAERLAAAGVDVSYRMFAGCMHAFTHFGPPAKSAEAWALIYEKLNRAFGR